MAQQMVNDNDLMLNMSQNSKTDSNDKEDNSHDTELKIAVVTGGGAGIGKGIAIKCGSKQFNTIIIVDINKNALETAKVELCSLYPKAQIISFCKDITDKKK
eukprot:327136_1